MLQNQQRVDTTQTKLVPCHVAAIIFSDLPSLALQRLGEQAIESEHSKYTRIHSKKAFAPRSDPLSFYIPF